MISCHLSTFLNLKGGRQSSTNSKFRSFNSHLPLACSSIPVPGCGEEATPRRHDSCSCREFRRAAPATVTVTVTVTAASTPARVLPVDASLTFERLEEEALHPPFLSLAPSTSFT
eukprot:scaffold9386_cov154-Ochromonas_danica.AAC.18